MRVKRKPVKKKNPPRAKKPGPGEFAATYSRLVKLAHEKGIDAVDRRELIDVCFELGRSKEQFEKDVQQLRQRDAAREQLRALKNREDQAKEAEAKSAALKAEIEKMKEEFLKAVRPVEEKYLKAQEAAKKLRSDFISDRGNAIRKYVANDPDGVLLRRSQWESELENSRRQLHQLKIARREVISRVNLLETFKDQFNAWRLRKPIPGIANEGRGSVKWPEWMSDGVDVVEDLIPPTAQNVRECNVRLQKLLDKAPSVEQATHAVRQCRERIATLERNIAKADKEIYG